MDSTGGSSLDERKAQRIAQRINAEPVTDGTSDRIAYPHRLSGGGWEVHVFWLVDRETELRTEEEAEAYVRARRGED